MSASIHAALEGGHKVSVFRRDGFLCWWSPAWRENAMSTVSESEILGFRWLEYIAPEDIPKITAWIADWQPGAKVHFRAAAGDGTGKQVHAVLIKGFVFGEHFIALGDNRLID